MTVFVDTVLRLLYEFDVRHKVATPAIVCSVDFLAGLCAEVAPWWGTDFALGQHFAGHFTGQPVFAAFGPGADDVEVLMQCKVCFNPIAGPVACCRDPLGRGSFIAHEECGFASRSDLPFTDEEA